LEFQLQNRTLILWVLYAGVSMGTQSVSVFVALVEIWSIQSVGLGYELTITEMPSLGHLGIP